PLCKRCGALTRRRSSSDPLLRLLSHLFWRERGDDFLESRIAAKRVPEGQQFQLAITQCPGEPERCSKLVTSEIFFPDPRSSDGEVLDHVSAVDGIFLHRK